MLKPSLYVGFEIDKNLKHATGYFISERRENVESWISSPEKRSPKNSPTKQSSSPEGDELSRDKANPFDKISERFVETMDQFDRLIPTTLRILPLAEMLEMNKKFYNPIAKGGSNLAGQKGFEMYQVPLDQFRAVDRAMNEIHALRRGRSSLPGMFLMGLVSSYDAFLAQLMHLVFLTQPELISSSEKNISFKDLVELGSIEAARNYIVEKEVETFLRQSHHAHFDHLEAKLKIPLRKDLSVWPTFVEICERRNLFTHTSGVVSSQYLRVCDEHKVDVGQTKVGDQLEISRDYLSDATETISELGLKLVQVVWRKLKPEEISLAASALNHQCFQLLTHEKYKLAQVLLEFGLSLKKHGDELTRKMMVVNLSIAAKHGSDNEKAMKILDEEDWSAASDKFRICVAAIKEDIETVVRYFPMVAHAGEIPKEGFRYWPAFRSVKERPEFIEAFEKAFGEAFVVDRSSSEDLSPEDKVTGENHSKIGKMRKIESEGALARSRKASKQISKKRMGRTSSEDSKKAD